MTLIKGAYTDSASNSDDDQNSELQHLMKNKFYSPEFEEMLRQIKMAFEQGLNPLMIKQGSSGSYFLRDPSGKIVGVFKPKDEEPYGDNNPKWVKWIHRKVFPCTFGRSCLIPNVGYLSEAGASLIDEKLNLQIVPTTRVVRLSNKCFNYTKRFRFLSKSKYPKKVGSLQTFVHGYKDAQEVIPTLSNKNANIQQQLQYNYQKLVVLDFITRNTDRGNDNWMIRIDELDLESMLQSVDTLEVSETSMSSVDAVKTHSLKIAAIDNGLSFPITHPENWRTYPYYWAYLEYVNQPFQKKITEKILPLIKNKHFVMELIHDLYLLFKQDNPFSKSLFKKQMSVMRGQIYNLILAMENGMSPKQMLELPNVIIKSDAEGAEVEYTEGKACFNWC